MFSNIRHAVGDSNRWQTVAIRERRFFDSSHTGWNSKGCQTSATVESMVFNAGHVVGEGNR